MNQRPIIMKKRSLLSVFVFFGFIFFVSGQHCVDFESLSPGDQFGDGINTVGELIFTENDIPVFVEYFEWNPGGTFGTAEVDVASGFGSGNVMWQNNINLRFDFTQLPYLVSKVSFIYADYGGFENFSVNGEPIFVGELDALPTFPGVTISHTATTNGGIINIFGQVDELIVGGQEFQLDDVCPFEAASDCVDFESLIPGTQYGDGINAIGEQIFTEADIPVFVEYFEWQSGGTFGMAEVDLASGFGTGNVMWQSNINLRFDFTQLPFTATKVTFMYADYGGFENFSVNGEPIFVGELDALPSFPGVSISHMPTSSGGMVTIYGQVDELIVGGQEFQLDDVCAYEAGSDCVDFESLPLNQQFGDGFNFIGEVIFAEAGIPVAVEYFHWNTGGTFGTCIVHPAFSDFGQGQIMGTNNINLKFDFTQLGFQVEEVTFEYADQGGFENLSVNGGAVYVGELDEAPSPPGMMMNVTTTTFSGGIKGFATLTGAIDTLMVGGQEFWLDNICVYYMVGTGEKPAGNQTTMELQQNYPNPVLSETVIPYLLTEAGNVEIEVYDLVGRKIKTLVDGRQSKGLHKVRWDVTDAHGKQVPAGIYLYSLKTGNKVKLMKMLVVD